MSTVRQISTASKAAATKHKKIQKRVDRDDAKKRSQKQPRTRHAGRCKALP